MGGRSASTLPPTQIGRALGELGIGWIGAHSASAKRRVERSFLTAQDRLVKGLRVAGARTLEQANAYLETEFIPWWNKTLVVTPSSKADAHRPLTKAHCLTASLSYVETRQVNNAYTIQFDNKVCQMPAKTFVRVYAEPLYGSRFGSMAIRFRSHYLEVSECCERPKAISNVKKRKLPKAALAKTQISAGVRSKKLSFTMRFSSSHF
jgi:hypothetical protein